MAKRGKGRQPPESKRPGPGRPPTHGEAWTKISVIVFNRQIAFLDRLAADIRGTTGAAINRASLFRAMTDALQASGLDLSHVTSEAEIRDLLAQRLKTR